MKKLIFTLLSAFIIFATANAQTANLQVIHNSSMGGLISNFDAWVITPGGPVKVLDDFSYREATAYLPVPSGAAFNIHLAPPTSTSIADTLAGVSLGMPALSAGVNYCLMAFNDTVDFALIGGVAQTSTSGNTTIAFFHGSDDAPTVDVVIRGGGTLFPNVPFGNFHDTIKTFPAAFYVIDVYDETQTTKLKSYYAPLVTANGSGGIAFASGFVNPGASQPAFGVFAALPNGTVVPLPEVKTAFAQILHNSADASATSVDVYVKNNLTGTAYENVKAADDLAFRAGTAVLPIEFAALTNDSVTIGVAPSTSSSIADAVWTKKYKLAGNSQYLLFANGILPTSSGYTPATPFDVIVGAARFQSTAGVGTTDVNIFHGVTDAPTIDVVETAPGSAQFADDLAYGEFSGYTGVNSANNYTVEIRDQTGTMNPLGGNFFLPLGLNPQASGAAIVVFASGFLDPASNNGGAALQLCAKGGTVGAATCFSPIPLSVEEKTFVSNMIMYPNPAKTNFNIEYMLESDQNVKVNVYNATGQLQISADKGVESKGRGITTINVSNLAKGMYLINVLVGDNVNVTRSIIVE
jgi:hypothetical protein